MCCSKDVTVSFGGEALDVSSDDDNGYKVFCADDDMKSVEIFIKGGYVSGVDVKKVGFSRENDGITKYAVLKVVVNIGEQDKCVKFNGEALDISKDISGAKRGDITISYKWIDSGFMSNEEWTRDSFYLGNATIDETTEALKAFHAKYKTDYVITGLVVEYNYE